MAHNEKIYVTKRPKNHPPKKDLGIIYSMKYFLQCYAELH